MNSDATIAARDESGGKPDGGALRADRLADGVLLLIGLTAVQRLVGFGRGIFFCRWLDPEALGEWDLAFSFLLVGAPLVVLGLPGTLGRYVEYFRQRGELRRFLQRSTWLAGVAALVGVALMAWQRERFAWLLFDESDRGGLVVLLAISLLAVALFNGVCELFTALRQTRVTTALLFAHSVLFAGLGAVLMIGWRPDATAAVLAYAGASLLTSLVAGLLLVRTWRAIAADESTSRGASIHKDGASPSGKGPSGNGSSGNGPSGNGFVGNGFAARVLPFAAWLWLTNLTANLFEVADRYMIVHLGGLDQASAHAMVGNYHSSRVVPRLMVMVAGLLAAWILPHLSHDWERGERRAVSYRHNLALKLTGLAVFAGSTAVLVAGPWLFGWLLAGKYDGGQAVLPFTLASCTWLAMSVVAMNYLYCAERPRLVCLAYVPGLILNVVLNLLLLPVWGLAGAVTATAIGNLVALAILVRLSGRLGRTHAPGLLAIGCLPIGLLGGAVPAVVLLIVGAWAAARTEWLLTAEEQQELAGVARQYAARLTNRWRPSRPATDAVA